MAGVIKFYFDFSSPYAHLASKRIEDIAAKHGRTVEWWPILLGAIFKVSGERPMADIPLMRDYMATDLQRCAREHNIIINLPSVFPIASVNAARAVYWQGNTDTDKSRDLVHALFDAYFVNNDNISDTEVLLTVAQSVGIDREQLADGIRQPDIKNQLKEAVDDAINQSIFGSPCCVVDGEQFWGNDRLDQLDKWLSVGGW